MKKLNLYFALMILLLSSCEHPIMPLSEEKNCFEFETVDTVNSQIKIFEKGPQDFGKAFGIKNNESFELSAKLELRDNFYEILLYSYWKYDSVILNSIFGEAFIISNLPYSDNTCFELRPFDSKSKEESITYYAVHELDIVLIKYELDTTAINQLEILEINKEEKKLKALFKATFITKTPWEPEFPEKVRFTNTEIEIGY